ncbi:MAG: glycoside hydrolase family 3 C-terminal domain-containing protein [Prevotella sp.]|nr:glycoside hydrolase family 3 C-terminal domain-containing protein [Prevotella sp.]
MRKIFLTLMSLVAISVMAQDIEKYPWLNRSLSFRERATLLVKELTLEEKAGQFGSVVTDQVTRDGVIILPHYQYWNEAIHGYARMGNATSFPESKGMSATWNPELIYQCADAISTEARAYHMYKTNQRNSLVKGWKIGLNVWSPTINMARDPRWGREEENYGEDPFLCGVLATQFVKGIQGTQDETNPYYKIVACAKHFAANNYEAGRHSTTSFVSEKNMREYYLPAFEMCVKDGNVQSLMAAYNAISTDLSEVNAVGKGYTEAKGGLPCSGNKMLLTDILRKEWGFNGYVTSDCAAVSDVYRATKHLYFGNYTAGSIATGAADWKNPYENSNSEEKMMEARATALCLNAGLNSNCEQYSSSAVLQRALLNALSNEYKTADELGYVNLTEETVDNALIELLTTRFALGEFDEDYVSIPWNSVAEGDIESEANQALALKAAQQSMTLMKNEGSVLPIPSNKTIALIGPYANAIQLGDYSGTPTYTTTPYQAFAKKMNFVVEQKRTGEIPAVPFDEAVVSKRGAANNDKGAGNLENTAPGDIFLYKDVDFGEAGCTNFAMSCGAKSSGLGQVSFILDSKDATPFLTVSNEDTGNWTKWTTVTASVDPDVVKGKHDLYVKFSGSNSYCGNYQYFNFTNPNAPTVLPAEETQGPLYMVSTSAGVNEAATDAMIDRAVAVAKKADYVIFLGGTDWSKPASHETGTEGHDRWVLTLPGNQAQVINKLLEVNSNVIVVLESGSSLDLSAISNVPAILEAWYGGQAQGQAICDAIFGDINPSGHLTSTWYADINELPQKGESSFGTGSHAGSDGMLEYNIDDWGYTYMYYGKATKKQQKGTPQFPFGYGLSYTTFAYSDASATTPAKSADGVVSVKIKNTGDRKGADVIQIYADFNGDSNFGTLNKRLVGFQRVELEPGEQKTVQIPVSYRSLAYYSEATHQFLVDGQTVKLQVATSSADADIQQTCTVTPAPGVAEETYVSTHIEEFPAIKSARQLLQTDHIYSVMGAYICSAERFDTLPKGVYVLNGVKYFKK